MAELLVCAKNLDSSGEYKKGDIVTAHENGWAWGRLETLPNFFVLKIPEVSLAKVLAYLQRDEVIDSITLNPYGGDDVVTSKRATRLWGLLIANVPQGVRDTIAATGEYTTTVAQIKQFVRNKITDEEATFDG